MTRSHGTVDAALAPVREALLGLARSEADAVLAQADQQVAQERAQATALADELLDQARAQAAADTAVLMAAEEAHAQRRARTVELHARRAAYDALVTAAAAAVRAELATDPGVVAALSGRALLEVGPDAEVTRTADGGLVAEAGGRRLRLPLSALVEDAVADLLASRGTP
jgi:hypothetical protein